MKQVEWPTPSKWRHVIANTLGKELQATVYAFPVGSPKQPSITVLPSQTDSWLDKNDDTRTFCTHILNMSLFLSAAHPYGEEAYLQIEEWVWGLSAALRKCVDDPLIPSQVAVPLLRRVDGPSIATVANTNVLAAVASVKCETRL